VISARKLDHLPYSGATILLPVVDETFSLNQTIETIEKLSASDVAEYLLIVCSKTRPESLKICRTWLEKDPARFRMHTQTLPFLGGALREAFSLAVGSHIVMMSSDLETDPSTVPLLIEGARRKPDAIITATRWKPGGGFKKYQPIKLVANCVFQWILRLLYGVRLSDFTFGFRIFPRSLMQKIVWEELRHPFVLETLLKPLRLGVAVEEVPSPWVARREGVSNNPSFFRNFSYFRIALKVRWARVHLERKSD
jgi:hypothetical protein